MSLALLLALLQTAAPPVADAEALARKGAAEDLFLKYGSVKASDYPDAGERKRLAGALLDAARASSKDPFIAVSLASRAVDLDESVDGLVQLSEIEVELDQRDSAAQHLDRALSLAPKSAPVLVARADLASREQDFALAVDLYERAQSAGAKGVAPKLTKARKDLEQKQKAVADLKETESQIQTRVAQAAESATHAWLKQIALEDEENAERRRLAPDGVREQEIHNFVFTYSTGNRSAKQMSTFEDKVERLLEKTYDFVTGELRHRLDKRTNVVLMSNEEYQTAHAFTAQANAAGYWDGDKIVINGGSTVDERFAEVMVHEFTHVVVSDIAGHGRVPRWVNEGLAEYMRLSAIGQAGKLSDGERGTLARLKKEGALPRLDQLDRELVAMGPDVRVAYMIAGLAAKVMIDQRGTGEYVDMLRDMGKVAKPLPLVAKHFMDLERLEQKVLDEID